MSPLRYFPTNALLNNNTNSNSNKKNYTRQLLTFQIRERNPLPSPMGCSGNSLFLSGVVNAPVIKEGMNHDAHLSAEPWGMERVRMPRRREGGRNC